MRSRRAVIVPRRSFGSAFRNRHSAARRREIIQEVATGQRYTILTCVPANPDCPTAAEHLVEAKRS